MPVYEYLCNACGPFKDMRPMAECDDPQDCPDCETRIAARVPDRAGVLLHAVRQAQGRRHQRAQLATRRRRSAEYKASHGPGCGCCSSKKPSRLVKQTRTGAKSFPTARPWMISH